jgi:hypothetical protein
MIARLIEVGRLIVLQRNREDITASINPLELRLMQRRDLTSQLSRWGLDEFRPHILAIYSRLRLDTWDDDLYDWMVHSY